jgi:hypothetical protein
MTWRVPRRKEASRQLSSSDDNVAVARTDAENGRLWEHVLHEDTQLFQRGNFFMLAESLLVVAYSGLLAASETHGASNSAATRLLLAARVLASFGLLLTAIWFYVGRRHLKYCKYIRARARDRLPEYRATREGWPRGLLPSLDLITYSITFLAGIVWILLLLIA